MMVIYQAAWQLAVLYMSILKEVMEDIVVSHTAGNTYRIRCQHETDRENKKGTCGYTLQAARFGKQQWTW